MIVSINQPAYLPWLGYFQRIAASDRHVVLDHVQFEKNSFTNRNKVLGPNGPVWLTVPVLTKGRFGDLAINSLEINQADNWRKKHWNTMLQCYAKAPHFDEHRDFFESVYAREWTLLADLCREVTGYLLKAFGINTPLSLSSTMDPQGSKSELVLDLCRKQGADFYLSGALGRDYMREEIFREQGIGVGYQDYRHPEYAQFRHKEFHPFMAAVDLLFNQGPGSLKIMLGGQEPL